MSVRRLSPWLAVIVLMLSNACQNTRTVPEELFKALKSADRIDVTTSTKQVRSIVQGWRIRKTASLLQHYASGWQKPLSGTPLSDLVISFRKGQTLLGQFGIGRNFVTMGEGLLWCQPLAPEDHRELLEWLAVRERDHSNI